MSLKRSPLFVLPVIAVASTAQAADVTPIVVAPVPVVIPPAEPLTHVHIEGGPVFSSARITDDPSDKFGEVPNDRGFYFGGLARRMVGPNLSIEAGAGFTRVHTGLVEELDPGVTQILTSRLGFQTFDVDVGFHPTGDLHTQFFGGLRLLHANDFLSYAIEAPDNPLFQSTAATTWAIGPRVGAGTEMPLGNSSFSLVAELSASFLYGRGSIVETFGDVNDPPTTAARWIGNVEGLIGLGWNPSEHVHIAIAYRAQQWWGLRAGMQIDTPLPDGPEIVVDPNKLIHGPILRIAIDF